MTPEEFNAAQLASGALAARHISELVRHWQRTHGLTIDGKAGPGETLPSLERAIAERVDAALELKVVDNWLTGAGVKRLLSHESWYGAELTGANPGGVVAHYTATGPGTALTMARTRTQPFRPELRPAGVSSWHATIETDGSIVQMVPFNLVAWHAGSPTAQPVPGLGWANYTCLGIELVSLDGSSFTPAQVAEACRLWRALVRAYSIPRRFAMITHASIDPGRRGDPGPVWMDQHAERVLDFAYAEVP